LNLGVYLKELGEETRPPEHKCHVRCRAATLASRTMPREPEALAALVDEVGVPWLDALGTKRGIAEFLPSDRARACFVTVRARELLGVPLDAPAA
jgi:hypothetical protein